MATNPSGLAGPGAPFPQWTVILTAAEGGNTGVVGKVTNALAKALVEATAFPSKVLFFTSQAAAQNYINSHGGAVSKPLQQLATAGQNATNAATGTLAGFLTSSWPLRIAEIALGLVLVAVGVAKLVPGFTPAQVIAKRVGVKV